MYINVWCKGVFIIHVCYPAVTKKIITRNEIMREVQEIQFNYLKCI